MIIFFFNESEVPEQYPVEIILNFDEDRPVAEVSVRESPISQSSLRFEIIVN